MKNQKGFAFIELLIGILLVGIIASAGYFIYQAKDNSKSDSSHETTNSSPAAALSEKEALDKLHNAFTAYTASTQEECPSYDKKCSEDLIPPSDRYPVAKALGITAKPDDTIYIGLQKGRSLEIGGLGTTYLNNKSKLQINDDAWYWGIGACSTNKRIFINASTSDTTIVHNYTYCGGVE